jgi:DNA-binding transcriptional regulator YiaG
MRPFRAIGGITVVDTSATAETCPKCGTASLSWAELGGYEYRAAHLMLTQAKHATGEALKYARKVLGLTQKELAVLLDTNEQQISRWEHEETVDRRLRLAMAELLDLSRRGERTLAELGTNASRRLEITPRAG